MSASPVVAALAPGLYPRVPFAEYVAWSAISASLLKTYLGRSPAHARHEQLRGKDSADMALGRAAHAAILEPDEYRSRYVPRWRATGTGSRDVNRSRERHVERCGQIELDDADRAAVEAMRKAVMQHPTAGRLIERASGTEVSLLWEDVEHEGARCKARLDLLTDDDGMPAIADLKTCRDASPRAFSRDIAEYGYHLAAAHYLAGAAHLAPGVERVWLWIAVETSEPWGVAVYRPDEELLRIGWEARSSALDLHLECLRSGSWPSYPTDVQKISAPRWMR